MNNNQPKNNPHTQLTTKERNQQVQQWRNDDNFNQEVGVKLKALNTLGERKKIEEEELFSYITSIGRVHDKADQAQCIDAGYLAIENDLSWSEVFIIGSKPGISKNAMMKIALRKATDLGLTLNYGITFYNEAGEPTRVKKDIDSVECKITGRVIAENSSYGNLGDEIEWVGLPVYKEAVPNNKFSTLREYLQNMAVRQALRCYFPEFFGNMRFDDELETDLEPETTEPKSLNDVEAFVAEDITEPSSQVTGGLELQIETSDNIKTENQESRDGDPQGEDVEEDDKSEPESSKKELKQRDEIPPKSKTAKTETQNNTQLEDEY